MGAVGASTTGFKRIAATGRLGIYYRGVLVAQVNATDFGMVGTVATTTLAATTTITAGTGLTVTAGDQTNTAGDHLITAGNARLGVVETFGTTQPTSAVVMKEGIAPVGAITTSGGIFSTSTVIFKIIADGSADAVGA
jgi:hypothetical protein